MATNTVKTGDQIAVHNPFKWSQPETWIYPVIRFITGSFWNHWAGLWVRDDGVLFVVEQRGGTKKTARRITRFEIWQQRNPERIYEILPSPISSTWEQIEPYRGAYDYFTLCFIHPVYQITGLWLGRKEDKAYICSEFWARILSLPNAYRMTPADMAKHFSASKK